MSQKFRDSESLGKSNGKKWLKFFAQKWSRITAAKKICYGFFSFAHKGYKIAAQKSLIFDKFCFTSRIFFCIGATMRIGQEMICLPYAGFFSRGALLLINKFSFVIGQFFMKLWSIFIFLKSNLYSESMFEPGNAHTIFF